SGITGITNDFISGDNLATMAASSVVDFKGAVDQKVAGVAYANLKVSGIGNKMLEGDASVSESVIMGDGIIATDAYKLTLSETATIVDEDNSSYILGNVVTKRTFVGAPLDFGNMGLILTTTNDVGAVTLTRQTGVKIQSSQTQNFSIARNFTFAATGENT